MSRWILMTMAPLFFVTSFAHAEPIEVTSPVHKVFVPLGFDDNDNAEVILHGDFPNSCYKLGPATASVDVESRRVTIEAKSWFYGGTTCAQVVIPFIQPIKLGLVPAGQYEIVVTNRPETEKLPLTVTPSTTRSADDFLYAPVDQVDLAKDASGQYQVTLEGTYPYTFVGCMKIIEVRAFTTPGEVVVVQPISQMFTDEADCVDQAASKHFKVMQPVNGVIDAAEYVAHVRALSGQSVNRLFDFR